MQNYHSKIKTYSRTSCLQGTNDVRWPCRQQQPCRRLAATTRTTASVSGQLQISSIDVHAEVLNSHATANAVLGELGEGLEAPVQLLYLISLLGFVVVGAYLVVRQVLVRRELEEAAKVLGERIRTNDATCEDFFELGVILLRKKLYTQATKNLEKASRIWDGEPEELAQVHNALGFAYFNMQRTELAVKNYRKAVELQPGYVTAWNNLGDAHEKAKDWEEALKAYEEALSYSPANKVAKSRVDTLRSKVRNLNVSS
ncbi:g10141 [Coccomyxa elongata]